MRSRQNETNIQPKSRQSQAETEDLQPDIHPPINPLMAQLGSVPNPTAHAAMLQRSPANPQAILQLQRQYGNRYVNQVLQQAQRTPIQTKLTLGAVGDKYEQEADRVAKQVVNHINVPATQSSTQSQFVQREKMPEEDDELMMKPAADTIQRQEMPEEDDELMMKPVVQRQSKADGRIPTELEASINQEKSNGQPLPNKIRQPMEQAFGADFSSVKIHSDPQSERLNQSIQAQAFTTGKDIFFRQGTYNPDSRGGQELIAHELTHVVQQGGKQSSGTATGIEHPTASESGKVIQRVKLPFRGVRRWLGRHTILPPIGGSGREGREERERVRNGQIIPPTNANNNNPNLTYEEKPDEDVKTKQETEIEDPWYQEIERNKPKDQKALEKIADKSTYKNLRKIGSSYDREYIKSSKDIDLVAAKILEEWQAAQQESDFNEMKSLEEKASDQGINIDFEKGAIDLLQFNNYKVKYLKEKEREQYHLDIEGGNFYQQDKAYDTKDSFTHFSGRGMAIYVMDPNGEFYAGRHYVGRFHHSSFLAGGAVAGAGEMKVNKGTLKKISTKSGHYKPKAAQMKQVLTQLEKKDVNLKNVSVDLYAEPELGIKEGTYPEDAAQFLEERRQEQPSPKEIQEIKNLGLKWDEYQEEWSSIYKTRLDRTDIQLAKAIVSYGGAQKLIDLGMKWDDTHKLWVTQEEQEWIPEKPVQSLEDLLKVVKGELKVDDINKEIRQAREEKKLKKDPYNKALEKLGGEEGLKQMGFRYDSEYSKWKNPQNGVINNQDFINLANDKIKLEELVNRKN